MITRKILLILLFTGGLLLTNASPLRFVPVTLTQPSGEVINVFASGDEYYNWVHDAYNFTIVQDKISGYYVYAKIKNDELIPTEFVVGKSDPKTSGLTRGLNISPEKMKEKRLKSFRNFPNDMGDAPKTGTINNLVIYIRFSGETEFTDTKVKYDTMFNNSTAGANSMYNYFREVSYNTLSINTTFYPTTAGTTVISYQDTYARGYYQPYNATTNTIGYTSDAQATTREHTLLKNAVNYVASQVPAGLNLDGDSDGKVDNVCFIVSGSPGAWADLLWPHRWVLYSFTVNINSKRVYDYNFQLQTSLSSSGVGVLCHEMFHSLGAPDLYHYTDNGVSPVYLWDIMEYDQNPPQHMGAYMKYRYGTWISSIPVITPGTYTLNPLTSSTNNCYRINSPNSTTEYFVVEYRKKGGVFESKIPGTGLLIYRINSAVDGQGNRNGPPDEVYIYRPNGTNTVEGSPSTAHFSSTVGRTSFGASTNPSPFLANGSAGGIEITNIGASGSTISFTLMDNNQPPSVSFSATKTFVKTGDTVYFSDNSSMNPTSWNWTFTGGTPSTSTLKSPKVVYNKSGFYPVSLTAGNANGSNSLTKTNYITVSNYSAQAFEETKYPPLNWTIDSASSTKSYWLRSPSASGYGAGSASSKFDFYNATTNTTQYLISETFTATLPGDSLKIDHAYATYSTEVDKLLIETSTNGGSSYTTLVTLNGGTTVGTGIVTAPAQTAIFTPTSTQWATKTYLLPAGTNKIRFKAVSAYGNNLYIDNITIVSSQLFPKVLSLKVFIEGLYNSASNKMIPDTMTVYLRNASSPYAVVDSAKGVIDSLGNIPLSFRNANNSTGYYYQFSHRNSLDTWSGATNQFSNYVFSYDMTTDSAKAYGNAMRKKGVVWCLYSGDINKDGMITLEDMLSIDVDNQNFVSGFRVTDIDGDGQVTLTDLLIADVNNQNFVEAKKPAVLKLRIIK